MRQKPKIFSQDKIYKKTLAKTVAKAPDNKNVTVLPKDAVVIDVQSKKFKELVSKVMKTEEFEKMKNLKDEVKIDIDKSSPSKESTSIQTELLSKKQQPSGIFKSIGKNFSHSLKSTALISNDGKKVSINIENGETLALREKSESPHKEKIHFIDSTDTNNHILLADQKPSSLIRQNIFGPLTFDDLYYT